MWYAIQLLALFATAVSQARSFVLIPTVSSAFRATVALKTHFAVASSRVSRGEKSALRMAEEGFGVPLTVGTDAPAFTVNDQDEKEVTLASFKGEKNVVVYFYPKDDTSGCTKEACTFRDLKTEYDALDCVVLGVSADDEASHVNFIEKLGLNFSLLADTNKTLVKAYGATKPGDKIQRSTVLVDKEGKVAAVWNPVTTAETHPNDVLAKLRDIL